MPDATALHLLDGAPWADSPWVDPLSLLGCYTSFVVEPDGRVADLTEHLGRLARDSALLLGQAVQPDHVRRLAAAHVAAVGTPVRLRVAVLAQTPPLQPQDVRSLHVATSSRPVVPAPEGAWSVQTVPYRRLRPEVKGVDPFLQLHLKREARRAGFDDALLTRDGALLEGTTWGLLAVGPGGVIAPERDVLPSLGVARLLRAAGALGLAVERRPLHRDELAGLRLLLGVSAVTPAVPIARVDGVGVSTDPALLTGLRAGAVPGTRERLS